MEKIQIKFKKFYSSGLAEEKLYEVYELILNEIKNRNKKGVINGGKARRICRRV